MKRRDKILRAYLPAVNPLVEFSLTDTALTFTNAAVAAHVADECAGYEATWASIRQCDGGDTAVGNPTTGSAGTIPVPPGVPSAAGVVRQDPGSRDPPGDSAWSVPMDVYFRRTDTGWALVGLDRLPPAQTASQ